MGESLSENFWVEQKQSEDEAELRKKRLEHVKKTASEKPNSPFVFIEERTSVRRAGTAKEALEKISEKEKTRNKE